MLADADGSDVQVLSPPLAYLDHLAWRPGVGMLGFTYDSNGDLWFDIGFINADGTGLRPVKLGTFLRDMWMGSWVSDGSMLVTQIKYNAQFDITGSEMFRIYISDGSSFQSFAGFVDPFYPHVQLLDDDPPISAVHPLPEYSRASGFPVSWSSVDVGVSGVHLVATETREGQTGTWTHWWSTLPDMFPIPYSGNPGQEIFFRSSASDRAGNVETWPPGDGDAHTTLYRWQMSGQVMDSRGHPVPLAPLGITPDAANSLQSGLDGSYLAYLIAEGDHRLTASHVGYGELPTLRQGVNEDEILDIVLPPQVNIVTNGGFENTQDPLAGWSITGTLPVTTTSGRSGEAAIRLGELCGPACLSPAEQPYTAHYYASPNMDYAPDGTLHVVWNRTEHAARSPAGVWSYEVIPGEFGTFGDVDSYEPLVKVDALGTLHVIVQGDTQAYYVQKPAGGAWSQPYELGDAWQTQMTADSAGGVHLTYYCYNSCDHGAGIFYLHRSPAGMWQTPIYIWNIWTQLPALTVGTDGIVHLLYKDGNLRYRQVRPDGTLTDPEGIGFGSAVALAMDPAGVLHALGNKSSRGPSYYSRQPSGEWTRASYLPVPSSNALQMDVDLSGGVHISVVHSDTSLVYLYKPAGSSGFDIHDVVGNPAPRSITPVLPSPRTGGWPWPGAISTASLMSCIRKLRRKGDLRQRARCCRCRLACMRRHYLCCTVLRVLMSGRIRTLTSGYSRRAAM